MAIAPRRAIFTVLGSGIFAGSLHAQTLSEPTGVLDLIAQTVGRICMTVPLETSHRDVELNGAAQAEVSGLVQRLLGLGVNAAAKYQSEQSSGVLQRDLANVIVSTNNCRRDVTVLLIQKLLPDSERKSQPVVAPPGFSVVPQTAPAPADSRPASVKLRFGILSRLFDMSNIRTGVYRPYDKLLGMPEFYVEKNAILFDIKIRSVSNGLPSGWDWSGEYFGQALDENGIKCGVARAQISMKYDMLQTGWRIGLPGSGAIMFSSPGCNVSAVSFEETSEYGLDDDDMPLSGR